MTKGCATLKIIPKIKMYNWYILLLFNLSIVKATMVSIEAYIRVSVITTFTSQSTFKTIKHLKIKFSFLYIFIITTFIYQIKRQISHRKLWRRPTLTLTLYINGMSTQEMEFMVDSISSLINGKSLSLFKNPKNPSKLSLAEKTSADCQMDFVS